MMAHHKVAPYHFVAFNVKSFIAQYLGLLRKNR